MTAAAFSLAPADPGSLEQAEVQHQLAILNDARLRPRTDGPALSLIVEMALRQLEAKFLAEEQRGVAARAAEAPTSPDGFMDWFEELRDSGPGQGDPLFPWLATSASMEQMRWFLSQEVAGEAGFDDLVALAQLQLPVRAKLEMARNYWDEMGRGRESGMHGPMLTRVVSEAGVRTDEEVTWEAVALGNLLVGLAANRHFAYQSIGALGVVELTAPSRAALVAKGLERLGLSPRGRRYYALHATLDIRHSAAWNEEVIQPLVSRDPSLATAIAEGALMRLQAGARCFERYRAELGVAASLTP